MSEGEKGERGELERRKQGLSEDLQNKGRQDREPQRKGGRKQGKRKPNKEETDKEEPLTRVNKENG